MSVATKEQAMEMLISRLMEEKQQLIDALRPFATAADSVDPSWACPSKPTSTGQVYRVLTHKHLREADRVLLSMGLRGAMYDKKMHS